MPEAVSGGHPGNEETAQRTDGCIIGRSGLMATVIEWRREPQSDPHTGSVEVNNGTGKPFSISGWI